MTRMTDQEALDLLRSRDLLEVGARAHEVRERLVPGDLATYIIDRNINYTNVCVSGCRFCAFHCKPGAADAYVLSHEEIHAKIQETLDLGGTAIMMQGGLHPDLEITWYEDLFRSIKERFDITIHSLSAPEIVHIAKVSGLTGAGDACAASRPPGSTRCRAAAPRSSSTASASNWLRARPTPASGWASCARPTSRASRARPP